MKKLFVPIACVLVGCAAGVAMPAITAQSFPSASPETPRWDQFCEENGYRRDATTTLSENAARHGREGFELVATTPGWNQTTVACYRRPAR